MKFSVSNATLEIVMNNWLMNFDFFLITLGNEFHQKTSWFGTELLEY